MAAIALLRLHHYTGDDGYRDKAEQTLETFAGVAEQFGIFAATYGIAVLHLLENPVQVVIVNGSGSRRASALAAVATLAFAFNKSVLRLSGQPGGCREPASGAGSDHSEPASVEVGRVVCGSVFRICLPAPGHGSGGIAARAGIRADEAVLANRGALGKRVPQALKHGLILNGLTERDSCPSRARSIRVSQWPSSEAILEAAKKRGSTVYV